MADVAMGVSNLPWSLNVKWKVVLTAAACLLCLYFLTTGQGPRYARLQVNGQKAIDHIAEQLPTFHEGHRLWPGPETNIDVWPGSRADNEEHVAICCAVRDQHEALKEWLTHHYHHLGIRRFYIMDDGSSPAMDTFEDWPIPRSALSFRYWTPELRDSYQQVRMYDHCTSQFGTEHAWMGFIDVDEFVEINEAPGTSMAEFLHGFEEFGALGINWIMHDSNGHLDHQQSVRKAYTRCIYDGPEPDGSATQNRHIKSFVQPRYNLGHATPHNFRLNKSMKTVDEHELEIPSAWRDPPTRERITLHHFATKSKAEMQEKIDRWRGAEAPKGWDWWNVLEATQKVDCSALADYRP